MQFHNAEPRTGIRHFRPTGRAGRKHLKTALGSRTRSGPRA